MYNEDTIKRVEYERFNWSQLFKTELVLLGANFKLFRCPFWELYYKEIVEYIDKLLSQTTKSFTSVLEAGCGSGKGSLLLKSNVNLTLVDISQEALNLAQFLAKKLNKNNEIKYIQANLFDLPLQNNSYDLVWNAGTIEHYSESEIISLIKEMTRVTKVGGYLIIGVPNPKSLAYKKAAILGSSFGRHWLRFIHGYRNNSEKTYCPEDLRSIVGSVINYKFEDIRTIYVGSCLLRNTPKFIIKHSKYIDLIFNKHKFMYLMSIKKK